MQAIVAAVAGAGAVYVLTKRNTKQHYPQTTTTGRTSSVDPKAIQYIGANNVSKIHGIDSKLQFNNEGDIPNDADDSELPERPGVPITEIGVNMTAVQKRFYLGSAIAQYNEDKQDIKERTNHAQYWDIESRDNPFTRVLLDPGMGSQTASALLLDNQRLKAWYDYTKQHVPNAWDLGFDLDNGKFNNHLKTDVRYAARVGDILTCCNDFEGEECTNKALPKCSTYFHDFDGKMGVATYESFLKDVKEGPYKDVLDITQHLNPPMHFASTAGASDTSTLKAQRDLGYGYQDDNAVSDKDTLRMLDPQDSCPPGHVYEQYSGECIPYEQSATYYWTMKDAADKAQREYEKIQKILEDVESEAAKMLKQKNWQGGDTIYRKMTTDPDDKKEQPTGIVGQVYPFKKPIIYIKKQPSGHDKYYVTIYVPGKYPDAPYGTGSIHEKYAVLKSGSGNFWESTYEILIVSGNDEYGILVKDTEHILKNGVVELVTQPKAEPVGEKIPVQAADAAPQNENAFKQASRAWVDMLRQVNNTTWPDALKAAFKSDIQAIQNILNLQDIIAGDVADILLKNKQKELLGQSKSIDYGLETDNISILHFVDTNWHSSEYTETYAPHWQAAASINVDNFTVSQADLDAERVLSRMKTSYTGFNIGEYLDLQEYYAKKTDVHEHTERSYRFSDGERVFERDGVLVGPNLPLSGRDALLTHEEHHMYREYDTPDHKAAYSSTLDGLVGKSARDTSSTVGGWHIEHTELSVATQYIDASDFQHPFYLSHNSNLEQARQNLNANKIYVDKMKNGNGNVDDLISWDPKAYLLTRDYGINSDIYKTMSSYFYYLSDDSALKENARVLFVSEIINKIWPPVPVASIPQSSGTRLSGGIF